MDTPIGRLVLISLLFLLIFISGFWLKHIGKPYHMWLVTFHKLISLMALVLLVITVVKAGRVAGPSAPESVFWILTGFLFLSAIVSGGLVSAEKTMPAVFMFIHHTAPFLTLIGTALSVFLLLGRR